MQEGKNSILEELRREMPALISRVDVSKYLGGLLKPGYLAQLYSKGKGPERIHVGRKVCYERESFLRWLESRTSIPDSDRN